MSSSLCLFRLKNIFSKTGEKTYGKMTTWLSPRLPANGSPQPKDSLAEEEETDVDTKSMLTEVLCRTVMGSTNSRVEKDEWYYFDD